MKNKFNKFLSLLLTITMILGTASPVYAGFDVKHGSTAVGNTGGNLSISKTPNNNGPKTHWPMGNASTPYIPVLMTGWFSPKTKADISGQAKVVKELCGVDTKEAIDSNMIKDKKFVATSLFTPTGETKKAYPTFVRSEHFMANANPYKKLDTYWRTNSGSGLKSSVQINNPKSYGGTNDKSFKAGKYNITYFKHTLSDNTVVETPIDVANAISKKGGSTSSQDSGELSFKDELKRYDADAIAKMVDAIRLKDDDTPKVIDRYKEKKPRPNESSSPIVKSAKNCFRGDFTLITGLTNYLSEHDEFPPEFRRRVYALLFSEISGEKFSSCIDRINDGEFPVIYLFYTGRNDRWSAVTKDTQLISQNSMLSNFTKPEYFSRYADFYLKEYNLRVNDKLDLVSPTSFWENKDYTTAFNETFSENSFFPSKLQRLYNELAMADMYKTGSYLQPSGSNAKINNIIKNSGYYGSFPIQALWINDNRIVTQDYKKVKYERPYKFTSMQKEGSADMNKLMQMNIDGKKTNPFDNYIGLRPYAPQYSKFSSYMGANVFLPVDSWQANIKGNNDFSGGKERKLKVKGSTIDSSKNKLLDKNGNRVFGQWGAYIFGVDEAKDVVSEFSISVKTKPDKEKITDKAQTEVTANSKITIECKDTQTLSRLTKKYMKNSAELKVNIVRRDKKMNGKPLSGRGTMVKPILKDNRGSMKIDRSSESSADLTIKFTDPKALIEFLKSKDQLEINDDKMLFKQDEDKLTVYYTAKARLNLVPSEPNKDGSFLLAKAGKEEKYVENPNEKNSDKKIEWAGDKAIFVREEETKDKQIKYDSQDPWVFGEVKNGTVQPKGTGEKWEAMGGEPHDEQDYLAVGGETLALQAKAEIVKNPAVDRTLSITVHFRNDWGDNKMDQWGWKYESKVWTADSNPCRNWTGTQPGTYTTTCTRSVPDGNGGYKSESYTCTKTDCTHPKTQHGSTCTSDPGGTENNDDKAYKPEHESTTHCESDGCGKSFCKTTPYTKKNFKTGDYVYASQFNNDENDLGGKKPLYDAPGHRPPDLGYGQGHRSDSLGYYQKNLNEYHPRHNQSMTFNYKFKVPEFYYGNITALRTATPTKYKYTLDSILYDGKEVPLQGQEDLGKIGQITGFYEEDKYSDRNGRLFFGYNAEYVKEKLPLLGHSVSYNSAYGNCNVDIWVDNGWRGGGYSHDGNTESDSNGMHYATGEYGKTHRGAKSSEQKDTAKRVMARYVKHWNDCRNKGDDYSRVSVISDFVCSTIDAQEHELVNRYFGAISTSKDYVLPQANPTRTEVINIQWGDAECTSKSKMMNHFKTGRDTDVKMKESYEATRFGYVGEPLDPTKKFADDLEMQASAVRWEKSKNEKSSYHSVKNTTCRAGSRSEDGSGEIQIPLQSLRLNPWLFTLQLGKGNHNQYKVKGVTRVSKNWFKDSLVHNMVSNGTYHPAEAWVYYEELLEDYKGKSVDTGRTIDFSGLSPSKANEWFKAEYMLGYSDSAKPVNKPAPVAAKTINNIVIHDPISNQRCFVYEHPDKDRLDQRVFNPTLPSYSEDGTKIFRDPVNASKEDGVTSCFIGKDVKVHISFMGDFNDTSGQGIENVTGQKYEISGREGYKSNMDTEQYVAVQCIRFPFPVRYRNTNGNFVAVQRDTIIPIWANTGSPFFNTVIDESFFASMTPTNDGYDATFTILTSADEYKKESIDFIPIAVNHPMWSTNGSMFSGESSANVNDYNPFNGSEEGLNFDRSNSNSPGDYSAYHDALKPVNTELIGYIGALTIEDTGDFRYSELFKKQLKTWKVPNMVHDVDLRKPYITVSDRIDTLNTNLNVINNGSKGENKSSTQWDKFHSLYCTQFDGNYFTGNGPEGWFHDYPLVPIKNHNKMFRKEYVRAGYPIYMSVQTTGNYMDPAGNGLQKLTIVPTYKAYNVKTKEFKDVDIYAQIGNKGVRVYDGGNRNYDSIDTPLGDIFLRWESEKARRNVTFNNGRKSEEDETKQFFKHAYDKNVTAKNGTDNINNMYPNGDKTWIGSPELIELRGSARTYTGCDYLRGERQSSDIFKAGQYGNDPFFSDISNQNFNIHGQRWHFTLKLPSSSRFVYTGEPPTDANFDKVKNDPNVVIVTYIELYAKGAVWTLKYPGNVVNSLIPPTGTPMKPEDPANPPKDGGPRIPTLVPNPNIPDTNVPVVVYDNHENSKDDARMEGTH